MTHLQDTKRSQALKRTSTPKRTTVPLPLEVAFRPNVRGVYNPVLAYEIDEQGEVWNPLKPNSVPAAAGFEFQVEGEPFDPLDDPWELRKEIFEESEIAHILLDGVTLGWGRFGVGIEDLTVPIEKVLMARDERECSKLLDAEYLEWRSLFREASTTRMSEWPALEGRFPAQKVRRLCRPMPLAIEWRDSRPTGVITCSGVIQAVIATLQIDALIGAEYRFCACVGCGRSFKVKRKDQRFCPNTNCKHRQAVRDSRSRKRAAVGKSINGGKDK